MWSPPSPPIPRVCLVLLPCPPFAWKKPFLILRVIDHEALICLVTKIESSDETSKQKEILLFSFLQSQHGRGDVITWVEVSREGEKRKNELVVEA